MFAYWEQESNKYSTSSQYGPSILCSSWSGSENDEYGWVATGNSDGVVGITLTTLGCGAQTENIHLWRKCYNFQASHHRGDVVFVKLNKQMDKLASGDKYGTVCLWHFEKNRWKFNSNHEPLENETNELTDMKWSNDGLMLITCLSGRAVCVLQVITGQGRLYPLDFGTWCHSLKAAISSCDRFLYVGNEHGFITIIDLSGADSFAVHYSGLSNISHMTCNNQTTILAIGSMNGRIMLFGKEKSLFEREIDTELNPFCFEWSQCGQFLAILGIHQQTGQLKIYNATGILQTNLTLPKHIKITEEPMAISWAHGNRRVLALAGGEIIVARVIQEDSYNLSEICLIEFYKQNLYKMAKLLSLPPIISKMLTNVMRNTIFHPIPRKYESLKSFLLQPVESGTMYCTIIHCDEQYILCMEYMANLIPLIESRQVKHIKPKFEITTVPAGKNHWKERCDKTDSQVIAHVVSNVWCTKFNIIQLEKPKELVRVIYKTSIVTTLPWEVTIEISKESTHNCNQEEKLTITNFSPFWNQEKNIYQLDCGGRVTKISEKNVRFDYNGDKVLQFGRTGYNSYALDFSYPFSPAQAFGVAITNLIHRLK